MGEPFRIEPQMPPNCYQTYRIAIPLRTHWRQATCEEVDCASYLHGWYTQVDEATEIGQRQAYYVRHDRSRRNVEERTPEGLTSFWFPPGQKCFQAANHICQNGRPERYIIQGGDWRGNPTGRKQELSANSWRDDFGEHQETLSDAHKEG
jgi:hypothetical protein